jgi:hypothetical protein
MNAIVKRLGALVLLVLCAQTVGAQAIYPNRPIKLIVPFPAGGGTDIVGRIISQKFAAELNQTIVIDNKSGAAGMIGAEMASKAAPDGYTLLLSTNSTHVLGPLLNPATPFNPLKDFSPIGYAAQSPAMMIVPLSSPAKTVKEFIQYAQKNPGKLNFGSAGAGGIPHLTGERFQALAGLELIHVPYKGTALAMPDLMAGRLDVMFDSFSSSYPLVRDGKVRALGISAAERSVLVPEVPLIAQDLPGFVSLTWFGVFGPAGLTPKVVSTLNQALNKALKDPAVVQQLAGVGIEAVGGSVADFTQKIAEDTARWSKVIQESNITLQ